MAVSDEESSAAYAKISEAARRTGLSWVLDQAEERIRLGRMDEKRVDVFREEATGIRRTRRKESRTVIVPLTPQEALRVLVDALDQAVVVVNRLGKASIEFAQRQTGGNLTFLPDPEAGTPHIGPPAERRELRVDRAETIERATANAHLHELLAELRRELPEVR